MEGKLPKPVVAMTRSPILVREYFDDVIPKPINWQFNSYVIHDPSLRSQMPSGTNLVSKQIRAKYSLSKSPYLEYWDEVINAQKNKADHVKSFLAKGIIDFAKRFSNLRSKMKKKIKKSIEEVKIAKDLDKMDFNEAIKLAFTNSPNNTAH